MLSVFVAFFSNFLWLFSIFLTITLAISYVKLSRYVNWVTKKSPHDTALSEPRSDISTKS